MKTIKYSRQRESIKNFLMERHDHPTADTVYMNMREQFPSISLGTVYRNLNLLVELGEIQKLNLNDGADRFDADTRPHYHFVCQQCQEVSDLQIPPMESINQTAQEHCSGKIDNHVTYFYGTCQHCLKKIQH